MFYNILAETSTIFEDANFVFTELIIPSSVIEFVLAIVIFGGAIWLYKYSEMPYNKASGSFITLVAVFYAAKWAYFYHELPTNSGCTQFKFTIIWILIVWAIMKVVKWLI